MVAGPSTFHIASSFQAITMPALPHGGCGVSYDRDELARVEAVFQRHGIEYHSACDDALCLWIVASDVSSMNRIAKSLLEDKVKPVRLGIGGVKLQKGANGLFATDPSACFDEIRLSPTTALGLASKDDPTAMQTLAHEMQHRFLHRLRTSSSTTPYALTMRSTNPYHPYATSVSGEEVFTHLRDARKAACAIVMHGDDLVKRQKYYMLLQSKLELGSWIAHRMHAALSEAVFHHDRIACHDPEHNIYTITFDEYDHTLFESFTTNLYLKVPHTPGAQRMLQEYAACYAQYYELFHASRDHLRSCRGAQLDESFPLFVRRTTDAQGRDSIINRVKDVSSCLLCPTSN
jgi:hypothetical protein